MSVNLYDIAYEVEQAIRQSNEYKQLKKMYDEVNADESARKMFENFRNVQMSIGQKQMMGEEISPDEIEHVQKLVALVQQHAKISQLMQVEQRMSMLISEFNRIVMKPLDELYGNPEE